MGVVMAVLRALILSQLKSTTSRWAVRQIHLGSAVNMPIKVGDQLPSVELFEDSPGNKVNIAELAAGKKVVIFGVPGAFTPGCSKTHLPGYVTDAEKIRAKAADLELDLSAVLGSVRVKRFSMLVDDGKVAALNVEPDGTGMTCSLAGNILSQL